MASLTIRNLDEPLKAKLRIRAATNGQSMEEEVRQILRAALVAAPPPSDNAAEPSSSGNLADRIRARVAPFGGVDLDIPPRSKWTRDPPTFD